MTLRALLLGAAASLSAVPDVSLAQDRAAALDDVVVTGSLIRGVNAATPVETVLAGLAGLFLAIDGVALTESRIGLLDVFIGFFATLTLYCLVRDREWSRARLARKMAGTTPGARAPHATIRPWLLAAGIAAGGLTQSAIIGTAVALLVMAWRWPMRWRGIWRRSTAA